MLKINVITQLLILMVLAFMANWLHIKALLVLLLLLLGLILVFKKMHHFIKALRRFKWLFAVMMLVYAFNTPGQHIQGWPFDWSPTYEGVFAGLTQAIRFAVILATITWIMAANTKQQLVSGFYFILAPLKHIELQADRFAARLWLTLHYIELQNASAKQETFVDKLKDMTTLELKHNSVASGQQSQRGLAGHEIDEIAFVMPTFNLADYIVIVGLVLMVIRVIL